MDDQEIPGEVYAWTAVLILPINSALNPILYTLSAVVAKKVGRATALCIHVQLFFNWIFDKSFFMAVFMIIYISKSNCSKTFDFPLIK